MRSEPTLSLEPRALLLIERELSEELPRSGVDVSDRAFLRDVLHAEVQAHLEAEAHDFDAGTDNDPDVDAAKFVPSNSAGERLAQVEGHRRTENGVATDTVPAARAEIDMKHGGNFEDLERGRGDIAEFVGNTAFTRQEDELTGEPDDAVAVAANPETKAETAPRSESRPLTMSWVNVRAWP